MKPTIIDLQTQIDSFDFESSEHRLSDAYKIAGNFQVSFAKGSAEFKLLDTFKSKLLKELRSRRPKPSKEPECLLTD